MRPDEPIARIMTEAVVAIDVGRPLSEAIDCFSHYSIHHLPVVRDGRLAGMLDGSYVMRLYSAAADAAPGSARAAVTLPTVEQAMRRPVTALRPSASLAEAAEHLIDAGLHAVPVVDESDRLIGIVTTTDIMRSLLRGPPRRGTVPAVHAASSQAGAEPGDEPHFYLKPSDDEYRTAMRTAELLHVEARDPRYLGKAMLYLDQRRRYLEKVLELADRFLRSGQDEHTHALLLKAILAAKRAEEHAGAQAKAPFPLT